MLKQKFQEDVKAALKSGDSQKRLVLGMLLSVIKNKELEKRSKLSRSGVDASKLDIESQLNDEETQDVLVSEIKKRKESITTYENGGRPELAAGEKAELEILMKYMPEQMSEDEVRVVVKNVISEMGVSDPKEMGKVIGQIMTRVKGKTDGQIVSRIVREQLK